MEKVIRDGKVAVLYSPGFGAGWYSWHYIEELVYDPNIVHWLETNEKEKIEAYVNVKFPDAYLGGLDDLTIQWLPQGTLFKINEYDGNESIELKENEQWLIT